MATMKTYEECPYCETEVKLKWKFEVQECPNCHLPILPCSICEHGFIEGECETHMNCDTCPLEALLKEAWINKLMSSVYSNEKNKDAKVQFLRTLNTYDMEVLYNNWTESIMSEDNEFDELDLLRNEDDI